ncbi:MAG TPA: extracellular solute-binding protein [Candidatus Acidoferrum sp.]|nr:extracellular solute-binding protein [Candidatus Acidoferrum sp.]
MSDDTNKPSTSKPWWRDYFATCEVIGQHFAFPVLVVVALVTATVVTAFANGCRAKRSTVTLYTSQDQHFAEPVLKQFTRETGIRVQSVFDSEAVKTAALANRLLAETNHPQCDVWWSNEELRTRQLASRGVFRETNAVAAFGFRSRRIVVNTNKLALADAPSSLVELTNERWRGKFAIGYPLFGTTSAQFVALRQGWGVERWLEWCHALAANKPFLVDGNSVVVKLVGRGEAIVGLTDSDDVLAGQREGFPIAAAPLTSESLLIPNTVAVVRGAPHPAEAQSLFTFLQSSYVTEMLNGAGAIESTNIGARPHLRADMNAAARDLETAMDELKQIFLR